MSGEATPPVPPAPKMQESWRGVVIVAVLCGSFLWWWFSTENTPEDAGVDGLVQRAVAALEASKSPRPLAFDFDLLELSMLQLRAGNFDAAAAVVGRIAEPALQEQAWRALARGHLQKDSGSLAPALQFCERIANPVRRAAAREEILLEITRMGLSDLALGQRPEPVLEAKIVRVMAETDGRDEAARRLPGLENLLTAAAPEVQPALREQLAWIHLWLGHPDRVRALCQDLPESACDELLAELFRLVRMEHPENARALLDSLPASLRLPLRLEAARLNGTLETPAELRADLRRRAEAETAPLPQAQAWLLATRAAWQLGKTPEEWKPLADLARRAIAACPPASQGALWVDLGQLCNDALEFDQSRRCLESARTLAQTLPDQQAIDVLAALLDAAFKNSEPEGLHEVLADLRPLLQKQVPSVQSARSIALVLFRDGDWENALALAERLPADGRGVVLEALAGLPVESSAGPGFALSQDHAFKDLRQVAASQGESEAAKLAMRFPPGPQRARSWLEIAKGLVVKSMLDRPDSAPAAPLSGETE